MTAFDAIVNFCEELGWVHFFQTLFNIGETMPYPFQGTVMAEILHVQEKENAEWITWYFAVWTEEGVPEASLTHSHLWVNWDVGFGALPSGMVMLR